MNIAKKNIVVFDFLSLVLIILAGCSGGGSGVSTLTPATLVSIYVTPENPSVAVGKTRQLTATGRYSDNSTKDITASVTWNSSDEAKATVNAGLVTSIVIGHATIIASLGEISGSAIVAVSAIVLSKTGQTTQYADGDDGALKMGADWPNPRFTDNGNGTVTDNLTGLMWLKDTNCIKSSYPLFDNDLIYGAGDGTVTWQHALDFVAGINTGTYSKCGVGHTDWRLPNWRELRSLIDISTYFPALSAGYPFTNFPQGGAPYWSSTTNAGNIYDAMIVSVLNGSSDSSAKSSSNWFVWPVRDAAIMSTISLPRTGQTMCYDSSGNVISCAGTGQDGELQKGVAWPNPRFVAGSGMATECVTDNLTGLIWAKDANLFWGGWQQALDYIATTINGGGGLCGYTDWRLPNMNELNSLIDRSQVNPTLPTGHPFINVQYLYLSSSTASPLGGYTRYDWGVYFDALSGGAITPLDKTFGYYVWPVRGGQ